MYIEAESVVQNAVSAHNTLVAQVEQDINASFEKELSMEREKINAAENMAEEVRIRKVKSWEGEGWCCLEYVFFYAMLIHLDM